MNHNLDLERCALHAALGGDGLILTKLLPEDFYEQTHRQLFEAFYQDYRDHGRCDLNRINHRLSGQDWYDARNGSAFLVGLLDVHWPYTPDHSIVDMLRDLLIRRTADKFKVGVGGARDIIEQFVREAEDMRGLLPEKPRSAGEVLKRLLAGPPPSLPFGFPCLDELVRMSPGQLVVVGARTGTGKTAFLCNVACNHARAGGSVLFCTSEMTHEELQPRLVSYLAGKPFRQVGERAAEYEPILDRIVVHEHMDTIADVEAAAGQTAADLVVVDYIQLLSVPGRRSESRVQELEEITRRLKKTAQRTGKVLLCASQLNRELDNAGRRPTLSDLRGCGSIEQDSNTVVLMYNPFASEDGPGQAEGKWGSRRKAEQTAASLVGDKGMIEFLVSKNRSGGTGLVKLKWVPEITTFRDVSGKAPPPSSFHA